MTNATDRLRNYPYEVAERAAIYEYEAGITRDKAEQKAIEEYNAKNNKGGNNGN